MFTPMPLSVGSPIGPAATPAHTRSVTERSKVGAGQAPTHETLLFTTEQLGISLVKTFLAWMIALARLGPEDAGTKGRADTDGLQMGLQKLKLDKKLKTPRCLARHAPHG